MGAFPLDTMVVVCKDVLKSVKEALMGEIALSECRHCRYKFIPRVARPKKCTACWGKWPLGDGKQTNRGD